MRPLGAGGALAALLGKVNTIVQLERADIIPVRIGRAHHAFEFERIPQFISICLWGTGLKRRLYLRRKLGWDLGVKGESMGSVVLCGPEYF